MKQIFASFFAVLFGAFLAQAADDHITYEGKEGPGKGKHIVLLSGDEEYRSEEGLPMLAKILSQRHGFKCTVLFSLNDKGEIDPTNQKSLSHPQALDSADAIIMLLRFRTWPDEVYKHFDDACNRGIPVIGLRTSTHAFRGKIGGFGKRVLGEGWVSHFPGGKGVVRRLEASLPTRVNGDEVVLAGHLVRPDRRWPRASGAACENHQKQHVWNKPPFPDEGTAHLEGSSSKFENTLKRGCFTSTLFRYHPCQNPQNL